MKRAKTNEDIVGKIYSIACKDFVTYDDALMYPGQHLNVLIGPNGTGKSTLVAAVILGMAGHPKHLSRSTNINDYVKNGKNRAWIQIKLYKSANEDLITFERSFGGEQKQSFKVDSREVSQDEYKKTIAKYNIQVDNLCQFLPQDRVQDFAKLNQQELLESTQKSVCSNEMVESFQKLKELRTNQKKYKGQLAENIKLLNEHEQKLSEMETVVEQMNIRKRLIHKINICSKKKIWLECDELKAKVEEIDRDLHQAKVILERDKKLYETVDKKSKAIEGYKKDLTKAIQDEANKIHGYTSALEKHNKTCEDLETLIRNAKIEFDGKKTDEAEQKTELANATRVLEAILHDLKNAIAACGPEEERKQKMDEFQKKMENNKIEIRQLSDQHRMINRKLDEHCQAELVTIKRKISSLENIEERKLNNLRKRSSDVYDAVMWVRQNQHLFDDKIFLPMMLELNVKDSAKNGKYVENIVSNQDLTAFTCVNKDDMNLLVKKLCTENKLKVSVVHSPAADECTYGPQVPIEHMRQYGFHSYLLDLIDGPAPILNFLCRFYRIQEVLIGDDRVNKNTDIIPSHIRVYFADNYRYSITKSKYTNETSSMRREISARGIFGESVDERELQSLKERLRAVTKSSDALKNERTEIEGKIVEKEEIQRRIQTEKKAFESKSVKVQEHRQDYKRQQQKVESIKSKKIDLEKEAEIFKNLARETTRKMLVIERKKVEQLELYQTSLDAYDYKKAKLNIFKMENIDLENERNAAVEAVGRSARTLEGVKSSLTVYAKKFRDKEIEAKNSCDGKLITDPDFPYKKQFDKLPNILDPLLEHIDKLQSRVDCIGAENANILDEYERIKAAVNELKEYVNNANKKDGEIEKEVGLLFSNWFIQINTIIGVINTNFSKFMSTMGYSGEVRLNWTDEKDYSGYGIQIFVKYRDDAKLQILDRFIQSGGERAVAIAVYTLSIQHISHVPFRCVDEINQGMDPRNERKIFEMLVQETAGPNKSQYFFVTPKLLSNLTSNDYMDVHIVYNGKYIENTNFFPFN